MWNNRIHGSSFLGARTGLRPVQQTGGAQRMSGAKNARLPSFSTSSKASGPERKKSKRTTLKIGDASCGASSPTMQRRA
jgi:hypothetical protein